MYIYKTKGNREATNRNNKAVYTYSNEFSLALEHCIWGHNLTVARDIICHARATITVARISISCPPARASERVGSGDENGLHVT